MEETEGKVAGWLGSVVFGVHPLVVDREDFGDQRLSVEADARQVPERSAVQLEQLGELEFVLEIDAALEGIIRAHPVQLFAAILDDDEEIEMLPHTALSVVKLEAKAIESAAPDAGEAGEASVPEVETVTNARVSLRSFSLMKLYNRHSMPAKSHQNNQSV